MKNCLILKLNQLNKKHRFDEKILIVPDHNTGNQILQDLSKNSPGWINFKTATAGSLASEIAAPELLNSKIEKISSIESTFIIDTIFTELAEADSLMYFEKYIINSGIISAITAIIVELKMAGLSITDIKEEHFIDPNKGKDIKLIFSKYQDYLKEMGLADIADIIAAACMITDKSPVADSSIKYIVLSRYANTPLEKKFINSISGSGPIIISEEDVYGIDRPKNRWSHGGKEDRIEPVSNIERAGWLFDAGNGPASIKDDTISLFSKSTYREEIYEILGRIIADKVSLDRVEIIYTSSDPYLKSLYNICGKLDLPATFSEGLPGDHSRTGMALKGFLLWQSDDFSEKHLRKLLKYSLIKIPDNMGKRLAHILRTSKIGWGMDRYGLILNKEIAVLNKKIAEGGSGNYKGRLDSLNALNTITKKLLEMVPPIVDGKIEFSSLCEGCIRFLDGFVTAVSDEEGAHHSNLKRSLEVLARLNKTMSAPEEAATKLLEIISKIPFMMSGPRPGHLYISSLSSGGRSGRDITYIAGMDSHKFPGTQVQDPILLDGERKKISNCISLSMDRLKEKLYGFTSLLSALRGRVVLSYSEYDIADERSLFPSSVYLQACRLKEGNDDIDYQKLLDTLKCSENKAKIIDGSGWWIKNLITAAGLKDARRSIYDIYPNLARGSIAIEERLGSELTEYDGLINPDNDELDPRKNPELVLSCSSIEAYVANPYAYFLERILNARRPREIERDRFKWLDPAQRGSLLHEVFQLFSRKMMIEAPDSKGKKKIINEILDTVLERYKLEVPVPAISAYSHEVQILRNDLEVFLGIDSKLCRPHQLEYEFGYGENDPVKISIGGDSYIHIKGKIDRIDIDSDGNYHVWDYKTGSAYSFNRGDYMAGGSQIQHILYGRVVQETMGKVVKSGYILPTEKALSSGKGIVFERDPGQQIWQEGLGIIFDLMAGGLFMISDKDNPPYLDDSDIYGTVELKRSIKAKIKESDNILAGKWQSLKDYR